MNSFEWNKIFGAIVLASLVASLAGFAAREAMHVEPVEKVAFPADQMQLADAPPAGGAPADAPKAEPIEDLLAVADVAAGQKNSRLCAACHSFDKGGPNKLGPNLWGIVGSAHGHKEDFNYSPALGAMKDKKWTYDALNQFLFNPRQYASGLKMVFAGIKNTKDRADLIAWLRTLADTPEALPAGK